MQVPTHCRLCDGACGLLAEVRRDGAATVITELRPDPDDPVSEGHLCDLARASLEARRHPDRVVRPLRRAGDRLVEASWDEAVRDIGARLRAIRERHGPRAVALYLGAGPWRSTPALARALAFAAGSGTPNVFGDLWAGPGPRLRVAELMLGWPAPLLSDIDRAHYALFLDAEHPETTWGPWQYGMAHGRRLAHNMRHAKARYAVAASRRTDWAEAADAWIPIRPGTEPFLLIGLLAAVLRSGRQDRQYVRDYTRNFDVLERLIEPWTPERCAGICGVDPAALSGAALRFVRAPMAVAPPSASTFVNRHSAVTAWAWHALHAVTANLLRPGGVYDHEAPFDVYPLAAAARAKGAPRTRVADLPLVLMQAPGTLLPDEALTPREGAVRALVAVDGDPLGRLPDPGRTGRALDQLELLVALTRHRHATAERADWVLPITHPWEEDHLHLHESALLPRQVVAWTPALVEPPGEARPVEDALADLFRAYRPGLRGGAFGLHLRLLGRFLATADLAKWVNRQVEWFLPEDAPAKLAEPPHRWDGGDSDRSPWRVDLPDERIDLAPEPIRDLVRRLEAPAPDPERPFVLRASGGLLRPPPDALHGAGDPSLRLHPDAGFPEGARVVLRTVHGEARAVVRHDPRLRPDVADLPLGVPGSEAGRLLSLAELDPITGAPALDGLACSVELAG